MGSSNRYNEPIQNAIEIIEGSISEKISVDLLAERAYFSKYHFQRMFRAIVGDTVMDYVKKRRLSLAGKELCETNSTILDVALKYGYNSHEGFTRAFKAFFGVTPFEYRKNKLNPLEAVNMSDNKENPVVLRVSGNLSEIFVMLKKFVDENKHVTTRIDETAESLGTSGQTLRIISMELKSLGGRTGSASGSIQEFVNSKTKTIFETYSMIFKIMKTLDDITFQTKLLRYLSGIEIARIGRPEIFDELMKLLTELAETTTVDRNKMSSIINDQIELISIDIREQARNEYMRASTLIREAAEKGMEIYNEAAEAVSSFEANGRAFSEIASTVKNGAQRLLEISGTIAEKAENSKITIHDLEDIAFSMNITAFNGAIETARAGNFKEFVDVSEKVRRYAGQLQDCAKAVFDCFTEAKKMLEVIKSGKNEGTQIINKAVDDFYFQDKIMSNQFKIESERLGHYDKYGFSTLADKVIANAEHCGAVLYSDTVHESAKIKEKLKAYLDGLKVLTAEIKSASITAGSHGPSFMFIAEEYEKLCGGIERFYEKFISQL